MISPYLNTTNYDYNLTEDFLQAVEKNPLDDSPVPRSFEMDDRTCYSKNLNRDLLYRCSSQTSQLSESIFNFDAQSVIPNQTVSKAKSTKYTLPHKIPTFEESRIVDQTQKKAEIVQTRPAMVRVEPIQTSLIQEQNSKVLELNPEVPKVTNQKSEECKNAELQPNQDLEMKSVEESNNLSEVEKPDIPPPKKRGKKTDEHHELLISFYEEYLEGMDEKQWANAIKRTGMSKAQINKYLWDAKNRIMSEDAEMKTKRGIIFEIKSTKTGKYLTRTKLAKNSKYPLKK